MRYKSTVLVFIIPQVAIPANITNFRKGEIIKTTPFEMVLIIRVFMDFMENLKRAVSDTAHAAVKKTGDIVETSKTKYSIYDLKNEIEKLYTDIGREVYESYRDDRNISDIVEEKCAAINELMQKMDILKQKLDK